MTRRYIRLFLPDSDNPYQQLQAERAAAAAERLGIAFAVDFADGDFALQVRQLIRATRQDVERPDAVLVMPVQEPALKLLSEDSVKAGVGWVYINRTTGNVRALRAIDPRLPIGYVAPDHREIGRLQAQIVRVLFPGGAHVLYVQGRSTTSSAQERRNGFIDAITGSSPEVQIAGLLDGHWAAKDTEEAVARWLQLALPAKLRFDAVVCQNDFMATGAIAALTAASQRAANPGLARLPVIGCDGMTAVGKRLVDQGRLAATIVVPSAAEEALAAVAAHYSGQVMSEHVVLAPRAYPEGLLQKSAARHSA